MIYGSALAWATLLSLMAFTSQQVTKEPPGPLYLPILTQRNITCSVEGNLELISLHVIFNDRSPVIYGLLEGREFVAGIAIISASDKRILVSVNTNITSVTGIRCEFNIVTDSGVIQGSDTWNLTLYGVPDPPSNISLSLEGNSLRSSWDYVRIPTVDVTLYWSLSFFRPSQLSNMTITLFNTDTYNYILQGVRSCDPFRLCITAENEVGNSSGSCVNNTLPYLPQREGDIEYSLVQVNEALSLNVTAVVPQECQSSMNTYCLCVISAKGNKVSMSSCTRPDDGRIHVLVENLVWNTSYNFSIISNNNLGQISTTAISFYTNNVEGVDICSLSDEEVYQISCRYVSGAARTGCSYQLSDETNSTIIRIELTREEYALHKASDINCCYNYITTRNGDGYVVMFEPFITSFIMPCQATTTATAASASTECTKCARNAAGLPIIITMGAIICIQIILCLMTPFITIFIYKKFFINPFKQKEKRSSAPSQEKDCSENPAYGVMPLSSSSQNRGKTNVLPEYEVVDLETKETSCS